MTEVRGTRSGCRRDESGGVFGLRLGWLRPFARSFQDDKARDEFGLRLKW